MIKRQYFKSSKQLELKYARSNKIRTEKRCVARRELEKQLKPQIEYVSAASELAEALAAEVSVPKLEYGQIGEITHVNK
jgi:hypothetical protein